MWNVFRDVYKSLTKKRNGRLNLGVSNYNFQMLKKRHTNIQLSIFYIRQTINISIYKMRLSLCSKTKQIGLIINEEVSIKWQQFTAWRKLNQQQNQLDGITILLMQSIFIMKTERVDTNTLKPPLFVYLLLPLFVIEQFSNKIDKWKHKYLFLYYYEIIGQVYNYNRFIMGQNCCTQFPDPEYVPNIKDIQIKAAPLSSSPKISSAAQKVQKELGQWKQTLSFERGRPQPPQTLEDGTIYVGQWIKNLTNKAPNNLSDKASCISIYKAPHGKGKMYFPDQSIFAGCFVNGVPNIQGRFISNQGVYYEGGILNSQANGFGKLHNTFKQYTYQGNWKEDIPNGFGIQTWEKVSQYQGQFQNGIKNGEGVYRRFRDYIYKGAFKNNQFSGFGIIDFVDGQNYNGNFLNGLFSQYGTYNWADKSVYEGQFLNGKKEGKGKYRSADGQIFEGTWKDGKRNGQCRLAKGGQYLDGLWVQDKFIGKQ